MCQAGGKRCASSTRKSLQAATVACDVAKEQVRALHDELAAIRSSGLPDGDTLRALYAEHAVRSSAAGKAMSAAHAVLRDARIEHAMTPTGRAELVEQETALRRSSQRSYDRDSDEAFAIGSAIRYADGRNGIHPPVLGHGPSVEPAPPAAADQTRPGQMSTAEAAAVLTARIDDGRTYGRPR